MRLPSWASSGVRWQRERRRLERPMTKPVKGAAPGFVGLRAGERSLPVTSLAGKDGDAGRPPPRGIRLPAGRGLPHLEGVVAPRWILYLVASNPT